MNCGKAIQTGALAYLFSSVFISLLLPTWLNCFIDNWLFPFAFFHYSVVFVKRKDLRLFFGSFLALALIAFVSELIQHGSVLSAHLSHLMLIVKFPVLMACLVENDLVERREILIHQTIDVLFLSVLGLNLFMALDINGLGLSLQEYYVPKNYTNYVFYNEWGTFRLSGTYTNPNNNAIVFTCFLIYYFFLRRKDWYYALLALNVLFFTQSRTIFFVLLIVGSFAAYRHFNLSWLRRRWYLPAAFLIAISGLIFSSSNLRSLLTFEAFTSSSLLYRFDHFRHYEPNSNLFFGSGVITDPFASHQIYLDSEYFSVLLQFGVIGLLILIGIFLLGLLSKITSQQRIPWVSLIILLMIVSATNTSILNVQVSSVPAFFMGLMIFMNSTAIKRPAIPQR